MKSSALLLYSLNYRPEMTGIGKYNAELLEAMASQGHSTNVICAKPYYPEWKVHEGYTDKHYYTAEENGVTVTRCPLYVPENPNTIKRIVHLVSFALSSLIPLLKACFKQRPKVLMVVQPTLFCTPMALLVSKLLGIKSLLHVQDFELDAMFGLSMTGSGKSTLVKRIAYGVERWLLQRFDAVSTISHSMMLRAEAKGVSKDKLVFFPNWSDTDFVKPGIDDHELRVEWGIRDYEKVVLYSGNIGAKQGLEMVLEAAEHYLNQPDVRFVIVGSGANKEALEQQAKERALTNVMFKPLIPWEQVPTLLSMADVHLVVQKKGAADAVLPSKLTNILSAGGHCVVTAEAHTELGCLAEKYPGIYSCIEPECLDAFIGAIDTELDRVASQNVNHVARRYAELNLNKDAVLRRFESDMDLLIGGGLRTTSENG